MAAGKFTDGTVWIDWDPQDGEELQGEAMDQGGIFDYPTKSPTGRDLDGRRWSWSEDNQRYELEVQRPDGTTWVHWMQPDIDSGGIQAGGTLYDDATGAVLQTTGPNSGTFRQ